MNGNVLQYPSNWILATCQIRVMNSSISPPAPLMAAKIYSGAGSPTPLGDAGFALEATAFKMTVPGLIFGSEFNVWIETGTVYC